jgi:alcohol dehydrogenase class IV
VKDFKCVVPKVLFGAGRRRELGEATAEWGRKAFLALDPFLDGSGTGGEIEGLLRAAGLAVVKYSRIEPDPDCFSADEAAEVARREGCDVVVAAGGGSALDFGKGVAVLAGNPGTAWQHTRRKDHTPLVPGPGTLPVVALPTTAGTGSEMTHYAVFSNPRLREKSTIVSERIIPRAALVDPELTRSCPPRLTALTGVDVLAHSIEAYINVSSSPFARLVSLEAIRLAGAWLPKAVADGSDAEARQQMAWASALGGIAIAHANPTLPHALGQAAGGFVHAPHGATVAACLAAIMRISHEAAPQPFADIASALDPGAAALPLAERAERSASLMEELLERIGARVRFGELGLREEDIERVTRIALTAYATGISLHPKKVDEREIQRIYRSCL